ncbi:putative leader peptide [Glycomyces mayteni]|uniref:Leader peptide n=1 Tax=Glycomyces mayteni TaxID=543887 RepID=A0ABW2D0L5_9ACTN
MRTMLLYSRREVDLVRVAGALCRR